MGRIVKRFSKKQSESWPEMTQSALASVFLCDFGDSDDLLGLVEHTFHLGRRLRNPGKEALFGEDPLVKKGTQENNWIRNSTEYG